MNSTVPKPIRILFQGDSITSAYRKADEINPAFQLGNGYAFLIAARLDLLHPGRYEFINRGIAGNTVSCLVERWEKDTLALQPDVLSLMIGINDTGRLLRGRLAPELDRYEENLRSLLAACARENPKIRFVLIEPFVLAAGQVTPEWRKNLELRQQTVAALAQEFDAVFVPTQDPLDRALELAPAAYWAYDGVHLTHAGFQLLADAWLEKAAPMLEQL